MVYGYYLHYRDVYDDTKKQTGINKKVRDQIDALNDLGVSCDFIFCEQPESIPAMVVSCLPGFSDGIKWPSLERVNGADFLYLRCPRFVSRELLRFLKTFKESNPDSKVIYEIPTYPYDESMKTPKMYAALRKDRKFRKDLNKYVDRISDLSGQDEIFGIPTVHFRNGINLKRIDTKKVRASEDDSINLMCAAFYCEWHGMDRAIEGLANYYQNGGKRNIVLTLAGAGASLPSLQRLAQKHHLEDHVIFPGILTGNDLDALYDNSDFAVSSLGMHRYDDIVAASIKTREYLAKGIPFIYAGEVDVFQNEKLDYCFQAPKDDSPIDFRQFVEFYDAMLEANAMSSITKDIRAYAERHVSMHKAMENVAEYLKP